MASVFRRNAWSNTRSGNVHSTSVGSTASRDASDFLPGLFLAEAYTVSRNTSEFLPGVVSGQSVYSQHEHIRIFDRGCFWPKRIQSAGTHQICSGVVAGRSVYDVYDVDQQRIWCRPGSSRLQGYLPVPQNLEVHCAVQSDQGHLT